jgi:hypothetical protein
MYSSPEHVIIPLNAQQRSRLQYNIKKEESMKHDTTEFREVRQSNIFPAFDDARLRLTLHPELELLEGLEGCRNPLYSRLRTDSL